MPRFYESKYPEVRLATYFDRFCFVADRLLFSGGPTGHGPSTVHRGYGRICQIGSSNFLDSSVFALG